MSEYNYKDINADSFTIKAALTDGIMHIRFSGDVDLREPGQLMNPFFDNMHKWLMENKHTTVTADFRDLRFMNSSGLKALARWIMKQTPGADHKYTIILLQDKNMTWQVTSLPTLTYLVPGIVKVQ